MSRTTCGLLAAGLLAVSLPILTITTNGACAAPLSSAAQHSSIDTTAPTDFSSARRDRRRHDARKATTRTGGPQVGTAQVGGSSRQDWNEHVGGSRHPCNRPCWGENVNGQPWAGQTGGAPQR